MAFRQDETLTMAFRQDETLIFASCIDKITVRVLHTKCPCGSGLNLNDCCYRFIPGSDKPATAEQLMRSRYTAFTLADGDYLYRSHHPAFRGAESPESLTQFAREISWQRLEVIAAQGGPGDEQGEVEFKAWHVQAGQFFVLHERSRFARIDGQWLYADGDSRRIKQKIGRNDPCPCGSGKKHKKCCG